jgi:cytochrome c-type biogenesis protein CcsB
MLLPSKCGVRELPELNGGVAMPALSLAAFWFALACCALATARVWATVIPLPFGLRHSQLALAGDGGRTQGVFVTSEPRASAGATSDRQFELISQLVLGALLVSLAARGIGTGHAPLTDLWEFTVAFAAAVSGFQLAFQWRSTRTGAAASADVALQPLVLLLLAFAAALPARIEPLAPALRSGNILVAHVAVMVIAYGALTVSFGAATLQLLQQSRYRSSRLPDARSLDEIAYGAVVVGFPLLALGIALGAYWASSAWGRYWGWDPKETSSLITWLAYGVYFHLHSLRRWSGSRSAVVLVVAYGCVLFSYFAVNFWVTGLHSYAGG